MSASVPTSRAPARSRAAGRRTTLLALAAALVALALGLFAFARLRSGSGELAPSRSAEPRVVSLAPAITETLFALGAGDRVVGVSNYCNFPPAVEGLPRTGSAITPAYEAIARLRPTLILASQVGGDQLTPLSRIAPTESLPWLSLDEVVRSTARLGRLVGREAEGNRLAERLKSSLSVAPPPNAPRVLLAMSYGDVGSTDVWFIRDNSLHGAALRAAGGRNAVANEVRGQPRLSVEELVRLDPDQIVLLVGTSPRAEVDLERFRRLTPLRAARTGRIGVVHVEGALDGGPRVLDLVSPLREEIRRLDALR